VNEVVSAIIHHRKQYFRIDRILTTQHNIHRYVVSIEYEHTKNSEHFKGAQPI
jgi:hypothetical protein